jgi:CDI immunity proteins
LGRAHLRFALGHDHPSIAPRSASPGQYTVEDLRIMIGQNIGLQYLIPLALEHLRKDPLSEGDFYPGDLLKMVLSAEPDFWREHPQWRTEVDQIAQRANAV